MNLQNCSQFLGLVGSLGGISLLDLGLSLLLLGDLFLIEFVSELESVHLGAEEKHAADD